MLGTFLHQVHSILRSALLGFTRGAASHSLAIAIIGLSLTALGAFGVLVLNLSRLSSAWEQDLSVTAFIKDGVPEHDVEGLRQRAGRMPGAAGATLVTRQMARERLLVAMGQRAQILGGLEDRVIPTALEVEVKPGATREDSARIAAELAKESVVEEVAWGEEELTRLGAVVGILDFAAALLGILIALVTVLVISSTLKLTVMARREEIEILKLVGASDLFVRTPFLLEGAAQGLAGAALACGVLVGAHRLVALRVEEILRSAFGQVSVGEIPWPVLGGLLVLGTVLGLIGGLVGVGRFLRV